MAELRPDLPVAATPADAPRDPDSILQLLKRGLGHELVNDDNVGRLIELAVQYGHRLVEQELREWHTGCGDGAAGSPGTGAPTGGFNREHAKR